MRHIFHFMDLQMLARIALARMEDCFWKISTDEQIFVVLVSKVCKWWKDRFLDLMYFFFKKKTQRCKWFHVFNLSNIMTWNLMKYNCMYFIVEMIESCLDLAWFVFWNDHTLSEPWLPYGKNVICLLYCLRMMSPSRSVKTLSFESSENFNRGDGLGHLAGCPTGRGRAEGSPGDWYWCYHSRVRFFHLGTHVHRILSALSYGAGHAVTLFGIFLEGSCPIEDEP